MRTSCDALWRAARSGFGVALLWLLAAGTAGAEPGTPLVVAGAAQAAEPAVAAPIPTDPVAAARSVVRATADEVLAVLADPGIEDPERRSRIEDIAARRFDFRAISRLVMGAGWKRMTPEQREEFVVEFQDYLSETYGSRITRYTQQRVDIVGERLERNGHVTVQTVIPGDSPVTVDYRLRSKGKGNTDGPWLVIDVTIEGVSVVASFRSQFKELMASGGPEEVLRRLRDKNIEDPAAAGEESEAS